MNNSYHFVTAEEAVSKIQSGQRVFVHGSGCTPVFLLKHLANRAHELSDVEIVSISLHGDVEISKPQYTNSFIINSCFVSEPVRHAVNNGNGDYVPVFLSEIPELFKNNVLPLDVAIIHTSMPDANGYCSLGVSVDIARTAVNCAPYVIAQVNPQIPRTHGDSFIHVKDLDVMVYADVPLPEVFYSAKVTETELQVGRHVAELVDNRCCIQMGIGTIPDAVLTALKNHSDLGVHSEMFSDGLLPLIESGVVSNAFKTKHPGKVVAAFALGTRKL